MKTYLILLFTILQFSGCQSSTEPNGLNNNTNSFFPMEVGNKWYYNTYYSDSYFDTSRYNRTLEIKNKIYLENKIFYLFEDTYYNKDLSIKSIDTTYYAIKNDSLFQIGRGRPLVRESIDFQGLFSEKPYGDFVRRKHADGDYMGYVYEFSDTTFTFYYYRDEWMDSGWMMTFQKNIGYIESQSASIVIGDRLVRYFLK